MGVRGFRPAGRVPFAAMQKEPKNRWGTARGTSGFALRPNGLTPRPSSSQSALHLEHPDGYSSLRSLAPPLPGEPTSLGFAGIPTALRWTDFAKSDAAHPACSDSKCRHFTGDTCIPTTMCRKPCSRCVSPPWPAGAARCGVLRDPEFLNGAG